MKAKKTLFSINFQDNLVNLQILQLFNREILQKEKETNWFMPILYTFCTDLRLLAKTVGFSKNFMKSNQKNVGSW